MSTNEDAAAASGEEPSADVAAGGREDRFGAVDFGAVFDAIPTPCLVLDADVGIVAVNSAFERVTGTLRTELVGVPLFEALPENPDDPTAGGERNVTESVRRVLSSGMPETMPLQKHDLPDGCGGFVERWWSAVNVPIPDRDGRPAWVVHRVEDVTDYVAKNMTPAAGEVTEAAGWRQRLEQAEAESFARAQELRAALDAEAVATRQLASLSDVALHLAAAESLEELTEITLARGLVALDVDGGVVAVIDDGAERVLQLTVTETLAGETRRHFSEVPLDDSLPVCEAAMTGERVLLRDRAACLAYAPEMADVMEFTGLEAWASVPLTVQGARLGALAVGWAEPHDFTAREVELLDALAAQCALALDRILSRQAEKQVAVQTYRLAEALQRSLLTDPPQPEHMAIAVRYLPAMEVSEIGGDWYDVFPAPDGVTTLVIGDVLGHDRAAAAAMGQIRNMLRGITFTVGEPPAAVLRALDRSLLGLTAGTLATGVLARVERTEEDTAHGRWKLHWSNAGHPPPVLVQPDGKAELLERRSELLLGLHPETPRSDHAADLPVGSTLVLYTDGLVERRGVTLDEGLELLRSTAEELSQLPVEELSDELLVRLAAAPEDDIAILVLRITA